MPNNRRRLVGRVVSDKMQKTIVVEIERRKMHRVYKKVVRTTKHIMAHDESDQIPVGAMVQVVESKPLSRHKRWVVESVLEQPETVLLSGVRALEPEVEEALGEGTAETEAETVLAGEEGEESEE
jgi:small subunit ribosomal protein S17